MYVGKFACAAAAGCLALALGGCGAAPSEPAPSSQGSAPVEAPEKDESKQQASADVDDLFSTDTPDVSGALDQTSPDNPAPLGTWARFSSNEYKVLEDGSTEDVTVPVYVRITEISDWMEDAEFEPFIEYAKQLEDEDESEELVEALTEEYPGQHNMTGPKLVTYEVYLPKGEDGVTYEYWGDQYRDFDLTSYFSDSGSEFDNSMILEVGPLDEIARKIEEDHSEGGVVITYQAIGRFALEGELDEAEHELIRDTYLNDADDLVSVYFATK